MNTNKYFQRLAGEFVLMMGVLGLVGWISLLLTVGVLGNYDLTIFYSLALVFTFFAYVAVRFALWFYRWLQRNDKK